LLIIWQYLVNLFALFGFEISNCLEVGKEFGESSLVYLEHFHHGQKFIDVDIVWFNAEVVEMCKPINEVLEVGASICEPYDAICHFIAIYSLSIL
jgi:hypothetical protein